MRGASPRVQNSRTSALNRSCARDFASNVSNSSKQQPPATGLGDIRTCRGKQISHVEGLLCTPERTTKPRGYEFHEFAELKESLLCDQDSPWNERGRCFGKCTPPSYSHLSSERQRRICFWQWRPELLEAVPKGIVPARAARNHTRPKDYP